MQNPAPDAHVPDDGRCDVLVVDNDADYAGTIVAYLSGKNLSAEEAWNGSAAIDGVRKFQPKLVLMDIDMPDLDGIEVAKQLHDSGLPSKVILMSGYPECLKAAVKSGSNVVAAVDKPVPLNVLAASVSQWLTDETPVQ